MGYSCSVLMLGLVVLMMSKLKLLLEKVFGLGMLWMLRKNLGLWLG